MHDAIHASLWVDTAETPDFGDLSLKPRDYDVLVIGAGIVGVTTALLLAKQNLSVCLIEADATLGVNTTTHSTVKATVAQGRTASRIKNKLGEQAARSYIHANQFGLDLMKRIISEHGIDCDANEGPHWIYATNPSDVQYLHEERELLTRLGIDARHQSLTATPAGAANPLPPKARMAFTVENQLEFHPAKYLLNIIRVLINNCDVDVAVNTRATDLTESNDTVRTETSQGTITSKFAVVATHYPFLNTGLHFAKLTPHREYALAGPIPADQPAGMTYDIGQQTHSTRTYELAHPNGTTERLLIVVGQGHTTGREDDAIEHYNRLHTWAKLNHGLDNVKYRWSTQDPDSLDNVPYIGRLSRSHDRTFTATGFGGWGMTNAHLAAQLITNEITNSHTGQTKVWAQVFDATRLELERTAKEFMSAQTQVAKALVSDHAKQIKQAGKHAEELTNNEHGLFEGPLKTIAAYRDDNGVLHKVSARCTHMGCLVRFNDAETTWDCPCHGSRFSVDGEIIEGPATEPLHHVAGHGDRKGAPDDHVDLTQSQDREPQ